MYILFTFLIARDNSKKFYWIKLNVGKSVGKIESLMQCYRHCKIWEIYCQYLPKISNAHAPRPSGSSSRTYFYKLCKDVWRRLFIASIIINTLNNQKGIWEINNGSIIQRDPCCQFNQWDKSIWVEMETCSQYIVKWKKSRYRII